jgi:xylulokinase
VRALGERVAAARTCALALAGQVPCLVAVADGEPLAPAVTWMDRRADALVDRRLNPEGRRLLYRRTGMVVDGRYVGPMHALHRAAWPRRPDAILSAKDYLYLALTGLARTDPSTAAGFGAFDLSTGDWASDLLALWDLGVDQVPPVCPVSHAPAGLAPGMARRLGLKAGIPVHVGAADSVAAVAGAGGLEEARVTVVAGSSTAIVRASRCRRLDGDARYLVTPHAAPGWYGQETDLLSTGAGMDWLARLCARDVPALVAAAAEVAAGAGGLRFAPYLAGGEQGVLWRGDLSGAMVGLTLGHGAEECMRALLEGIAFEARRCLEVLEGAAADGEQPTLLIAGGAGPPTLERILASVLGRPVKRVAIHSAAAYGAAILSGATALRAEEPETVRSAHAKVTAHFDPDPAEGRVYATLYRQYVHAFPRRAVRFRARHVET